MSLPTVGCPRCGALNEPDFGQCIRCNQPLDEAAPAKAPAKPPVRRVRAPEPAPRAGEPMVNPDKVFGIWGPAALPGAKLIFAINFLIFAIHLTYAAPRSELMSLLLSGGDPREAVLYGALPLGSAAFLAAEPWRIVSANWVHFGLLHFGFNMLGIVQLSRLLEPAIGTYRYVAAYVVTGIIGFAASAAYGITSIPPGSPLIPTAGASASLFGVLGIVLGFLYRRGDPRWKQWAGQTVFYALMFGFLVKANNAAHLGGLVAGVPFGLLFASPRPTPAPTWVKGVAIAMIVASVASLGLARFSPVHELLNDKLSEPR